MLTYTSVERMLTKLPSINSITNISSADIFLFAEDAEAEVNGYLARLYSVPVLGSPLLTSIATDVALYKLLSQRIVVNEGANKSSLPMRYKESLDLLKAIAEGEVTLVSSGGGVIDAGAGTGTAWSNTMGYHQTMNEGTVESMHVDHNKIADIAAGHTGRTWHTDSEGNTVWD